MEDLSASTIDTRIVYGFPGSGKTTYIVDCIMNDFFYKYGNTLILCFEKGKETYDEEVLRSRNAVVAYYEGRRDYEAITIFCRDQIKEYHPDRIYVEMNTMYPKLRQKLPEIMHVTSTVTWFDWSKLDWYLRNYGQMITQMVSESQQVTFYGCPSKEMLAPYSQEFQLLNHKASYLRKDPMGYHEKAFDLFVPYSLDDDCITISEKEYLVFWLDASEHPERYDRKTICFTDPLELRRNADRSSWSAGRVVMTCCMSDLQFMSFGIMDTKSVMDTKETAFEGGWLTMQAVGRIAEGEYRQKVLKLEPESVTHAAPPRTGMILQSRPVTDGPALRPINMLRGLNRKAE